MALNQPPIQENTTDLNGKFPNIWALWFQYIADNATFDSVVVVRSANDLKGVLDSNKVYLIDGNIDMRDTPIIVPSGGLSIGGLNSSRDTSVLTSDYDNYTMFITESGSYSGGVVMENMTITVTGENSKVFDLDNDGNRNALDITNVNFTSCTSLGELSSYRQLLMNGVGFIFIDDGLTFNGTWSGGIAVVTTIAVVFPAATLFKEGNSLLIQGSVRSDINFLSVNEDSVLFDFTESNIVSDSGLTLSGARTTANDPMPNLPSSSPKVRYSKCVGFDNTYVGGDWSLTSTAVTTISASNTLYKVNGTTTYSDMQWFTNTTDNAFVYNSSVHVDIEVKGNLTFTNSANKTIGIYVRKYDDSASLYVDVVSRFSVTIGSGGGAQGVTFFARTDVDKNDRIEIWIENQSDTSNVTCELGGFVGISERQS